MRIPVSTLSNRVSRLEESLGTSLLDRNTRVVRLTDIGQEYLTNAAPALEALDSAAHIANEQSVEPTGQLRITLPNELGQLYLARIIERYRQLCPEVSVDCELSNRRIRLQQEGLDIAIRAGKLEDSSLICKPIGSAQQLLTCASPKYLATYGIPVAPTDLKSQACLMMTGAQTPSRWDYLIDDRVEAIEIDSAIRVNHYGILRELALVHQGIIRVPSFLVNSDINAGTLTQLLTDYSLPSTRFHVLFRQSGRLSPKIRRFLQAVEECLDLTSTAPV